MKLSDGTKVFENGINLATNEKYIENTSYDRFKAEKAKKRPERTKKIVGCCAIIIILGLNLFYNESSFGPAPSWPSGVY